MCGAGQFCERTELVRVAILEAVPGTTASCQGDAEDYHTTLTASDLSGIETLDLNERRGGLAMIEDPFAPGDLDGLTGVRTLRCKGCFLGAGQNGEDPAGRYAGTNRPRCALARPKRSMVS